MTLKPSNEAYKLVFEDIYNYSRIDKYYNLTTMLTGTTSGLNRKEATEIITSAFFEYLDQFSINSHPSIHELNIAIKRKDLHSPYEKKQYFSGIEGAIAKWKLKHNQYENYKHEIFEEIDSYYLVSHSFRKL